MQLNRYGTDGRNTGSRKMSVSRNGSVLEVQVTGSVCCSGLAYPEVSFGFGVIKKTWFLVRFLPHSFSIM